MSMEKPTTMERQWLAMTQACAKAGVSVAFMIETLLEHARQTSSEEHARALAAMRHGVLSSAPKDVAGEVLTCPRCSGALVLDAMTGSRCSMCTFPEPEVRRGAPRFAPTPATGLRRRGAAKKRTAR